MKITSHPEMPAAHENCIAERLRRLQNRIMRWSHLAVFFLIFPLHAQRFTAAQRQADLDFVATQLPKLHVDFFFQLNPGAYQQAAAALQAQISSLTDAEFYVRLAALVAMAGDPHTAISLTNVAALNAGFTAYPLQFRWLDDGVFVTSAAAPYAQALGAQLVAIGGVPLAQAVEMLGTVIPHANDQWLHYEAQQYLTGQQILQGLDILPVSPASPLTFQTLAGERFTLQVATDAAPAMQTAPDPSAGPVPDFLEQRGLNYWYSYSAANKMLYFKYNVCENDPSNPFTSFAAALLATLDSKPVSTLVLDFRGNTGGDSSVIDPLLNGLAQRISSFLTNPQFRAYDVIDKGTFSSGMDDAMQIKSVALQASASLPSANISQLFTVIGEPTGGEPNEYGEVVGFTLPGSGLNGQYSTEYQTAPPGIPDTTSFMPDVAVSTRSTDYFARYDPVFGAMLGAGAGPPPAPSGNVITVNAASFRIDQGIAPGGLASAFGSFQTTPDQVLVNGSSSQLLGANSSQATFVIPASASLGPATISVEAGGVELANGEAALSTVAPAIFAINGTDPSQPGAVENQDYSVNGSAAPAAVGSVVQIYATGYGPPGATPQVFFADTPGQVVYSAPLSQYPGLWLIDAVVPQTLSGQVPIFIAAGNLVSNAVTIFVQ
jgi:uncharacterized protein (TIGR03437 family)